MTSEELEKSIKEIWDMFKETDRKFQETDRKFQETDRKFKETDRKFKETDRKFQETDRQFKEIAERFKETDRKFKETDALLKQSALRLEQEIAAVNREISNLGGKWGHFVEGIVKPSIEQLFQERGIKVERSYARVKASRNGDQMEIDILAVNGKEVVLIEVKSSLSVSDIDDFLEEFPRFRKFFPEYADRKIYGAVAGIVIEEGADRYAYKKGLFVIAQKGEMVEILNDKKFVPRSW